MQVYWHTRSCTGQTWANHSQEFKMALQEWQCHLCYLHVYIFLFTPQAKNDCCLRPFWVWIGFLVPFLFARDTLECEKIRERGRENSTAIKTLVLLRTDRPTDVGLTVHIPRSRVSPPRRLKLPKWTRQDWICPRVSDTILSETLVETNNLEFNSVLSAIYTYCS